MADLRDTNRQNRLRAALRENLKRRKEQVRGRAGQQGSAGETRDEEAPLATDDAAEAPKDGP